MRLGIIQHKRAVLFGCFGKACHMDIVSLQLSLPRKVVLSALLGNSAALCAVQDSYQPTEVCTGLWIVPDWCEPPQPDALNIRMVPGLAFGTG